jgi:dTDP-4-dehydrorhamnose 3,5-epimerase
MNVTNCIPIDNVLLIEPKIFGDARGFFMETYRAEEFTKLGITGPFVQDNHSGSRRGILRGLHYQIRQTQGKLVSVAAGDIFDVAVDLRRRSPTFGTWVSADLSGGNHRMIWVPPGFAHGYLVTSEHALIQYKVTDYYAPAHERTLIWNDSDLAIPWPLESDPILSEKDRQGARLKSTELFA